MEAQALIQYLSAQFNALENRFELSEIGQITLQLQADELRAVAQYLKDDPTLFFDQLACISAVDHGLEKNLASVSYHLNSIVFGHRLCLRIEFERSLLDQIRIPSLVYLWPSADWHEREAYDMLGIVFDKHPDLRRILCPDDWVGFPLRKDYVPAEQYHGLKITFDR